MNKEKTVKTAIRNSAYVTTMDFCHFAKEHDFIEVTEWTNHEGFDLIIESARRKSVHMNWTWGEWDAFKTVSNKLSKMK